MKEITVENFGDVRELNYNDESRDMEAIGVLSPTDVERLLKSISEAYAKATTKRGKAIASLAAELAKLYWADCGLVVRTRAHVATGQTIVLSAPHETVTPSDSPEQAADKLKAIVRKTRGRKAVE